MKRFIATLACALVLAAGVCHAAQDKIHVSFYDYSRTELSKQIKNNIIKQLNTIPDIKIVDVQDSYVGEINIHITTQENPELIIFFYYMFYKGRFMTGFYTGLKIEIDDMCKNIVRFYIETFEINVQRSG